jgi:AraC family carnitine catabolism transcriptional activator
MPSQDENGFRIFMVVTPSFNSFATMGFIDPFRASNYLLGRQFFKWHLLSETGGICPSSNGTNLVCERVDAVKGRTPDLAVVSSSWTPELQLTPSVRAALQGWARNGTMIGGLDTGAFVLARLGLLNGRKATTHYEHIDALKETFPEIDVVEDLFVFDDNRMTCCGGTASVDFGLHFVEQVHGAALANAAARYIFHTTLRERGARQQPGESEPLGARVPGTVKRVIQIMEDHLEDPLSIPQICALVGVSQRQVNRLFSTHVKKTAAMYYRDIRLDRARGLVTQTEMTMSEISVASGFSVQSHFSRAYKERFGLPPIKDHVAGRVPFEFRAWPMHQKFDPEGGE